MKKIFNPAIFIITMLLSFCGQKQDHGQATGKLFIIGGGNRTDSMMNELIDIAGRNAGFK